MAAERRKCFRILGLQEGASEEEIRKAYKKLALQYHPDKNESDDAKSKFQEIGYAYKYLTEGPSACGTADPHDIRDEILRRMFEEMFFARFRSPFGGFPFFCEESDDDDYYVYSDSSDNNCYCGSCNTENNRRTHQSTWTPQATPSYSNVSKKQMRKREKRQRQRERAKEHKRQDRWSGGQTEKQQNKNPDKKTDNVNAQSKKEAPEKPVPKDTTEEKNDTGGSRPDTPVLKQQPQKMNKKQRKKIESEQRKREKEMEEIAVELKKKQEQEMEKRREKERLAAQKREEENENEINYSYLLDNGKKSRKARQREKKRQVSGNINQQDLQRDDSCGSVQSEKPFHNLDVNNASFPVEKVTEESGPSIDKNAGPKSDMKKFGLSGNRYNVLDDIDDLRPRSGSSVSSSGSLKNSQASEGSFYETGGVAQNSGYSFQDTGRWNKTSGPTHSSSFAGGSYTPDGRRQFKSRTYQNSNRYQTHANRNNNLGYVQSDNDFGTKMKTSFVPSEAMGKDKLKDEEKSISTLKGKKGVSDDSMDGTDELEDESGREFVKDWSATPIDDGDNLDDLDLGYGAKQNGDYGGGSGRHPGQNSNLENKGNFRYGNNNSYQLYNQRGFPSQRRREFIPKTRGYHGPEFRPFYGWPPSFPAGMAGPPPFPGQRFQPPYHPHFRGNFMTRPAPRYRGGGYPGQRYGPPMEKTGYSHGSPGRPLHPEFPPNKNKGNIPHNRKKNMEDDSKSSKGSYVKSYENNPNCKQDVREVTDSNERVTSPEIGKTSKNEPSASGHFDKNMFSDIKDNQAGSRDSFDSLDDFVTSETGPRPSAPASGPFSYETVDMGLDEFLSKDNLGVPKGMFSESIKNYYK